MLRPKAVYFFYFAAMASLMPFLVVHYQELGFSGRQIGVLSAAFPLMMLLGAPFWGLIADTSQRHRTVMLSILLMALGCGVALAYLQTFFSLIIGVAAFSFFLAPIIPLVDSHVLKMLGAHKNQYGRTRVWGAVGWGLAAPIVGILTERYGLNWAFYVYGVLMLLCFLSVSGFSNFAREAPSEAKAWQQFLTPRWRVFLTAVFIGGLALAVCNNFYYLYLADLQASRTVVGLSLSMATLSELPFTFFGALLLARYPSRILLYTGLLLLAVRLSLYSLATTALPLLFIQLMHGATFSIIWIAGVAYADQLAPRGMSSTAQGLFSATMMGLGAALGSLLGGVFYDSLGPIGMFRAMAGITFIASLVLYLVGRSLKTVSIAR